VILVLISISLASAECHPGQIDINSASLEGLDNIVWVGPATAQKIVDTRPYKTLDDLKRVNGIGDFKLEEIKKQALACVGEDSTNSKTNSQENSENSAQNLTENTLTKKENLQSGKEKAKNVQLKPKKEPILLGTAKEKSYELTYKSKNALIIDHLPYAFSVFLILIVAVLLRERF